MRQSFLFHNYLKVSSNGAVSSFGDHIECLLQTGEGWYRLNRSERRMPPLLRLCIKSSAAEMNEKR